jgi:hypothetical protein
MSGSSPVSGAEKVVGWDGEIDRLFVGLRRSAGVEAGPGVEALLGTPGGSLLLQERIIDVSDGRLVVRRPLLTDEVHRQVLDLEPPDGWVEPAKPDNL